MKRSGGFFLAQRFFQAASYGVETETLSLGRASQPLRRMAAVFEPIRPVPPMMTILICSPDRSVSILKARAQGALVRPRKDQAQQSGDKCRKFEDYEPQGTSVITNQAFHTVV